MAARAARRVALLRAKQGGAGKRAVAMQVVGSTRAAAPLRGPPAEGADFGTKKVGPICKNRSIGEHNMRIQR